MLTPGELQQLKAYMRIDGNEDDELITALSGSAEIYLAQAGVVKSEKNVGLYNLALWSLTLHYYDHRGEAGSSGDTDFPSGLRLLINQMKFACLPNC